MTEDEKRDIINFFGTIHAQAKQTDQRIVGHSQFVKPISPTIQSELQNALSIPQQNIAHTNYHQPVPEPITTPAPVTFVQPEQQVIPARVVSNEKDDVSLINALENINLSLQRIGDILEHKYVKPKRIKNTKPI